jgi:hypothetical protein
MMRSKYGAALEWGFILGFGLRTYLVTPGAYAMLAAIATQPYPVAALLLGMWYGVARGMTIAVFALKAAPSARSGIRCGEGLERWMRVPIAVALAAIVVMLLPFPKQGG